MKLPEPSYYQWRDEADKVHHTPYYTEAQMREMYCQGLDRVASQDWTEIMREGALVTWGDAETLGDRVVEVIRKLKEQVNAADK